MTEGVVTGRIEFDDAVAGRDIRFREKRSVFWRLVLGVYVEVRQFKDEMQHLEIFA
ncbi:MAG: hypothetical protein M1G31_15660 [Pseudanabaena sp. Salubria-1]|nr:hypothetical protein [Pseudanabaena sp. Salubria-1]